MNKIYIKRRIALDARFVHQKMVGIARYTLNLIVNVLQQTNDYTLYCLVNTHYFENYMKENYPDLSLEFIYIKAKPLSLREHIELPWILFKERIDLFHATSYITPIWVPCKFVYSIHDTHHLIFPKESTKFAALYSKIIVQFAFRRAKHVLTMSANSKKDIIRFFGTKKAITVTYQGYAIKKNLKTENFTDSRFHQIKPGYILFIGNGHFHKNSDRVVKAYADLKTELESIPDLVLNIKKSRSHSQILMRNSLHKTVHFIGKLSDAELIMIYKNALCLVNPSLYEGFGLFLIEAMHLGIPIITSKISAMPEIVDTAALLVDPYSVEDIKKAMERIIRDKKLRLELITKGKERLKLFSWRKCAADSLAVYKSILL